jgi:endo-1,4-beta-mannosidase
LKIWTATNVKLCELTNWKEFRVCSDRERKECEKVRYCRRKKAQKATTLKSHIRNFLNCKPYYMGEDSELQTLLYGRRF